MSSSSVTDERVGYSLHLFEERLAELETRDAPLPQKLAFYARFAGQRTHQFYFDRFWRLRGDSAFSSLIDEASVQSDGNRTAAHNYLTHGIHPYKGKYFPQVVRSLLNMAALPSPSSIVDPFVGSGTTSLEASLMELDAHGFDRNPLAALIARTKVSALSLDSAEVEDMAASVVSCADSSAEYALPNRNYLERWFPAATLAMIETILGAIRDADVPPPMADLARVTLSSLLRQWSFQEPSQLRIYRRAEVPAASALHDRFVADLSKAARSVALGVRLLNELGVRPRPVVIAESDARDELAWSGKRFSALVTSPPYASALPYIDTDRLSIYALGLDEVERRSDLEFEMIGNREITKRQRVELERELEANEADLPTDVIDDVKSIQTRNEAVGVGFRRENLPALLYRYFSDMKDVLGHAFEALDENALCALVIGDSVTTAGKTRFRIRTADFLCMIAEAIGFTLEERIAMGGQAAYLPHQRNGIQAEEILIFRRSTS